MTNRTVSWGVQISLLLNSGFLPVPFCDANPPERVTSPQDEKRGTTEATLQRLINEGMRHQQVGEFQEEGKDQEAIQAFGSAADGFKQAGNVGLAAGALNSVAQIYEKRLKDAVRSLQ
jgi:hypothetical protein